MPKILFIPITSLQAEVFVKLIGLLEKELKKWDYVFLSMDVMYENRYPHYLVEPFLKKKDIPFLKIENFNKNPHDILQELAVDIVINCQDVMDPTIRMFEDAANELEIPTLVVQAEYMFDPSPPYNSPEQKSSLSVYEKFKAIIRDIKNVSTITSYGYNWPMRFNRIFMRLNEIKKGTSSEWGTGKFTKIAVAGEYTKKLLMERGVDETKIVITGIPRWDQLVNTKIYNFNEDNNYKTNQKKIILFTTQPLVESGMWTEEDMEFFISNVVQIVGMNDKYELIMKLHPRDKKERYKSILKKNDLEKYCIVTQNANIYELLRKCDLLLTHICTTAIEAMILEKPVLIIDFKYPLKKVPFIEDGTFSAVLSPDNLLDSIEEVIKNYNIEIFSTSVYNYAYLQDGNSSERVVELIKRLIGTNRIP
ncbi:MAG: CDP-glycerol glycerophosphotransferase family protein [Methanobacterium sp.]|jgi:hypothetical protein